VQSNFSLFFNETPQFIKWVKQGEFSLSREHVGYETGVLRPPVSSVLREVATTYGVSEEGLLHGQRGKGNEARQVAMYLARELCNRSLKEHSRFPSEAMAVLVGPAM